MRLIKLPASQAAWPGAILEQLYLQHPYLVVDSAKVVLSEEPGPVVLGGVHLVVNGQKYFVPVVIKEGYLYPMDLVFTPSGELLPLTQEVIYSPQIGHVSAKPSQLQENEVVELPTTTSRTNSVTALSRLELLKQGEYKAYITPKDKKYTISLYRGHEKIATYTAESKQAAAQVLSDMGFYYDSTILEHGGWIYDHPAPAFEVVSPPVEMSYFDGTRGGRVFVSHIQGLKEGRIGSFVGDIATEPVKITKVAGETFYGRTMSGTLIRGMYSDTFAVHEGKDGSIVVEIPRDWVFAKVAYINDRESVFFKEGEAYRLIQGGVQRPLADVKHELEKLGFASVLAQQLKQYIDKKAAVVVNPAPTSKPLHKLAQMMQGSMADAFSSVLKELDNMPEPQSVYQLVGIVARLLLGAELGRNELDVAVLRDALKSLWAFYKELRNEVAKRALAGEVDASSVPVR